MILGNCSEQGAKATANNFSWWLRVIYWILVEYSNVYFSSIGKPSWFFKTIILLSKATMILGLLNLGNTLPCKLSYNKCFS